MGGFRTRNGSADQKRALICELQLLGIIFILSELKRVENGRISANGKIYLAVHSARCQEFVT